MTNENLDDYVSLRLRSQCTVTTREQSIVVQAKRLQNTSLVANVNEKLARKHGQNAQRSLYVYERIKGRMNETLWRITVCVCVCTKKKQCEKNETEVQLCQSEMTIPWHM